MVKRRVNKKANGGHRGRPNPLTAKISATRDGKRRYDCGGKLK